MNITVSDPVNTLLSAANQQQMRDAVLALNIPVWSKGDASQGSQFTPNNDNPTLTTQLVFNIAPLGPSADVKAALLLIKANSLMILCGTSGDVMAFQVSQSSSDDVTVTLSATYVSGPSTWGNSIYYSMSFWPVN